MGRTQEGPKLSLAEVKAKAELSAAWLSVEGLAQHTHGKVSETYWFQVLGESLGDH